MTKKDSKQLKSYLVCSCLAKEVFKSDLVNILSHHSCHRDRKMSKPMSTFKATPSLSSALAPTMPSDSECSSHNIGQLAILLFSVSNRNNTFLPH